MFPSLQPGSFGTGSRGPEPQSPRVAPRGPSNVEAPHRQESCGIETLLAEKSSALGVGEENASHGPPGGRGGDAEALAEHLAGAKRALAANNERVVAVLCECVEAVRSTIESEARILRQENSRLVAELKSRQAGASKEGLQFTSVYEDVRPGHLCQNKTVSSLQMDLGLGEPVLPGAPKTESSPVQSLRYGHGEGAASGSDESAPEGEVNAARTDSSPRVRPRRSFLFLSSSSGSKEKDAQSQEPPMSPTSSAMRRRSRTETWNDDEKVEATELYRKKKVVENSQRRLSSTDPLVVAGSCSKTALGLISHPRFEMALAMVIIVNATVIGVQADWTVQNVGSETPVGLRAIDYTFTVLFTFELMLRMAGEGTAFVSLHNRNLLWNLFDFLLVGTAITGDLVGMFVAFGTNISVIRLLRVLRLARAIRLIRVLRFFKDLRVMITGIAESAQSLLWSSGLLLLIIYMYAICVLQVVGDHLDALSREGSDGKHASSLTELYGSLPLTVYTLFGCISGGHDWVGAAAPLVQIHPLMGLFNMVYVGFAVFCVLNVITGVFVENAFKINTEDDDKAVLDLLESRKQWIHEIKDLFKLADKSNTGYVDWAEFNAVVSDVRVQAVFHRLGLHVEEDSAALLFELLDFGGTGYISLDDFAEGIQRVRGNARSIDMCQLLHDNRELKRQLGDMMRSMDMLLCGQQRGGKMHAVAHEV